MPLSVYLSKNFPSVSIPPEAAEAMDRLEFRDWWMKPKVPEQSLARRFNIFPVEDTKAWSKYTSQKTQMWDPEEIDFRKDIQDMKTVSPRYRELVADLLGFFAPGDGIVIDMIDRFRQEATTQPQRFFYNFQMANESVHAEGYGLCIQALFDSKESERISAMVDELPCVTAKADFMLEYTDSDVGPGLRFVAGAASEGIFFVGLFAIIFYLRSKGVFSSFAFLNEQVAKDEFLHRDMNITRAREYDLPRDDVIRILERAVGIEQEHINYILRRPIDTEESDAIAQITTHHLHRFIAGLADQILIGLGQDTFFTSSTPTPGKYLEFTPSWMTDSSLTRKTNFYEGRVGSYKLAPRAVLDDDDF